MILLDKADNNFHLRTVSDLEYKNERSYVDGKQEGERLTLL